MALVGKFNALMNGAGLADAPADPTSDPNPVQRFIYNAVPKYEMFCVPEMLNEQMRKYTASVTQLLESVNVLA